VSQEVVLSQVYERTELVCAALHQNFSLDLDCQDIARKMETVWNGAQEVGIFGYNLVTGYGSEAYRVYNLIDELMPLGTGKLIQLGILVYLTYVVVDFYRESPRKHPYDSDNAEFGKI
jgi:HD-like signal output (HDOD) protein